MSGQKRRLSARFPPSRIKKIMQKDAEVGRIAMSVPVLISRALEMFLRSLLTEVSRVTQSRRSSVVSVAHMKQCIESERLFHFLRELLERSSPGAGLPEGRGRSLWPMFRNKQHEISVKKSSDVVEVTPRRSLASLDDSSSGESELFICL